MAFLKKHHALFGKTSRCFWKTITIFFRASLKRFKKQIFGWKLAFWLRRRGIGVSTKRTAKTGGQKREGERCKKRECHIYNVWKTVGVRRGKYPL